MDAALNTALQDLRDMCRGKTEVTLCFPQGWKAPRGFPRGELLCVNAHGERVRAINTKRLLAWCDLAERQLGIL